MATNSMPKSLRMTRLVPKTEKEFQTYLKEETARYAEANVRAGYWKKTEALKKSIEAHNQPLPQGLATLRHHMFAITIDNKKSVARAFIYDLFIKKPYRGKGLATQAILLHSLFYAVSLISFLYHF